MRKNFFVLGIDPGLEGAAAILESDTKQVTTIDLPTTGEGTKRCINELALHQWLGQYSIEHAYIEYVSAMQQWGVASSFRFGMSFGALRAIVALRGIPYTLVTPVKWKKFYNLAGGDKESSRQRAIQLFPKAAQQFERKKDHQRGEAALIAAYGLQIISSSGG